MNTGVEKKVVDLPCEPLTGLVFDIQGHSVHDGPGTRTTVFMSGCPLSCIWCSNPEGICGKPMLMHRDTRCKKCGACIALCPQNSPSINKDGDLIFNRELCDVCTTHECIENCFNEAIIVSGKRFTLDDLIKVLERDRGFWGSRGGVTFSGGEPLYQRRFISAALKACKERYIHTCIETTSYLSTDFYLSMLPYIDWIFTDIKHMDSEKHLEITGVRNELILQNIRELAKADWDGVVIPRIPVIPGVNDSEDNIAATAAFIKDSGLDVVNLLPFHRLGESKWRQLGKTYAFAEQESPSDEVMKKLQKVAQDQGIYCFVGWETPF
jgi:pyruvate formate lyase activating enzyme